MVEEKIVLKANESRVVEIDAAKADQKILCEVGEGAKLALSIIGEMSEKKSLDIHVICHAASEMLIVQKSFGSISATYRIIMDGEGSACEFKCAFRVSGKEEAILTAELIHKSPHTKGNISIKGVCEEKSHAHVSGMIKVEKAAQHTVSYFRDDILLFDEANANSLPNLEIEANDVRASHGSTTSRINEDQLLYLQSRGVSKNDARQLIINGFLAI